MSKITIKTPAYFLTLAVDCNESLPEAIVADVAVEFIGDDWVVSVGAITNEAGDAIDPSWLDEHAGYDLTLRDQIKLHAMAERFTGRY